MKKKFKLITLIFCILFLISSLSTALNTSESTTLKNKGCTIETKSLDIQFMQPEIITDEEYIQLNVDVATSCLCHPGQPLIPIYQKTIIFPFGTKVIDISIDKSDIHSISLPYKILPSPEPIIHENGVKQVSIMNEELYSSGELYPTNWYRVTTGGGLDKNNERKTFVTVQLFPIRYNATTNQIIYVRDMTININYQEPQESFLFTGDTYDMVIIAPEIFASDLQPLITHKNVVGVTTFLKKTEEIYNQYSGIDKPEKIKYFIKDAIETWDIHYVLLVGGLQSVLYGNPRDDANQGSKDWHLPVRYTNLVDPGSFSDPGFISDLYFMDIYDGEGQFSSWDSNNNGIFAEWKQFGSNKDIIDFYPDVYVGRLACRNTWEVKNIVNKIITYETTPIDSSWYNRMVLVGGDSFDDSRFGTNWPEDELICDKLFSYMENFEAIRLFASNRDIDNDLTPLTTNILRELNVGCGFIVFAGHGCPYKWVTNWPGEFDKPIENGGIAIFDFPQLHNGDKLPICCIEGGCHNSLFNVSLLTTLFDRDNSRHLMTYGIPTPECLGWSFVRKNSGGAIACFGYPSCTYLSPGETGDLNGDGYNEPDIFEAWRPYMVQQYYKIIGNGTRFLGDAAGGAVRNYIQAFPGMNSQFDAKIIEQVIFFGDPSLKIGGYS